MKKSKAPEENIRTNDACMLSVMQNSEG